MNEQTQTKDQLNQSDQPEYKDRPLLDTKSKKRQGGKFGTRVVKNFKEIDMPQESW